MSNRPDRDFWRTTPLDEMSREQWESLCDGCGKCCTLKFEDEDTGVVAYTDIACRLFDDGACRCGNYALRRQLVKDCVILTPETLDNAKDWMPRTCAYRVLAEGGELAEWHPLVSGDPESVHRAGISVRGRTVPEYEIDEADWEDRVIEEIEP